MGFKKLLATTLSLTVAIFAMLIAASGARGSVCGEEPCNATDMYFDR